MEELNGLADLLDLQAVDLEIDRLIDRRGSLPELEAYRHAHAEEERLAKERATLEDRIRDAARTLDRTSGELDLTEQKAAAEENRLYAGGMSARDADYLRREVEMLRRQVSDMEEQVLELMEERERLDHELEAVVTELEGVSAEKGRLEALISEQWRAIDAELGRKERRKAEIVPTIDPDLLELYEELRRRHEGVVVGTLTDGICGVCHLQLSAAEQVAAARERPPRCVHCRGILVL